jgi:hypothetical protein
LCADYSRIVTLSVDISRLLSGTGVASLIVMTHLQ